MMLNNYIAPIELNVSDYHLFTPIEEYNFNFIWKKIPNSLISFGGVKLIPLVPSLHAQHLFPLLNPIIPSNVYRYLPYGPFPTLNTFLTFLETKRRDPATLFFIVYDLSLEFNDHLIPGSDEDVYRPERIAGMTSLLNSSDTNVQSEIGNIHVLPRSQRSHCNTHACGLLLDWCFKSSDQGGLALRRVCWYANHFNTPSTNAAKRLGFAEEGILRWDRGLAEGKDGLPLPAWSIERERSMQRNMVGRHSAVLATGFDDWFDGRPGEAVTVQAHVAALMARPVERRRAWE